MHKFNLFLSAFLLPIGLLIILKASTPFKLISSMNNPSSGKDKTKTHDYASIESGARVLHTSSNLSGAKSILSESKDKYMLVPCKEPEKWVEICLNEDIQMEGFRVTQREIYSSYFKDIAVYGATEYPPTIWSPINKFTIDKYRETQYFKVDPVWVRFIRIEFLTVHDDDYYCTLTQFSVYGTSMLHSVNTNFKQRQEEVQETINKISKSDITFSKTDNTDTKKALQTLEELNKGKGYVFEPELEECQAPSFIEYLNMSPAFNTSTETIRKLHEIPKTNQNEIAFRAMIDHMGKTEIQLQIIEKYMKYLSEVSQSNTDNIKIINSDIELLKKSLQREVNLTQHRDSEVNRIVYSLIGEANLLKGHIQKLEHEQAERDQSIEKFSSLMILVCILELIVVLMLGLLLHSKKGEMRIEPLNLRGEDHKHYPRLARSVSCSSFSEIGTVRRASTVYEDIIEDD